MQPTWTALCRRCNTVPQAHMHLATAQSTIASSAHAAEGEIAVSTCHNNNIPTAVQINLQPIPTSGLPPTCSLAGSARFEFVPASLIQHCTAAVWTFSSFELPIGVFIVGALFGNTFVLGHASIFAPCKFWQNFSAARRSAGSHGTSAHIGQPGSIAISCPATRSRRACCAWLASITLGTAP